MFKDKKKALADMMGMLDGERAERIKVVVSGDTPKEVKKGLEAAKEKIDDIPKLDPLKKEADDSRFAELFEKLSPEKKKEIIKQMES